MTEDLFPVILANVVDIQKEHLLLQQNTQVIRCENVRLYRLLLKHCIYVSVTKPTCPALSAWLNIASIRSLKVTGKDITLCSFALPSKLCAALHGQSNVGLMCNCKPWGSLDLSVLVEILSGVDNDHGTGPRRNGSIILWSTLCPIERRPCWPKTPLSVLIWLITFCKLDNFFLTSQASTLYYLEAFYGVVRVRFSTKSKSMKSATAFLPMVSGLAMPGLAATPKYKLQFIVFKPELKGLVKPETASLVLVLLCIRAYWIFHFSALKSCFNILSSDVNSNTLFYL